MAVTIKYTGTQIRWPELSITGKQSVWNPGQIESREDAEAALLLASGVFSAENDKPLTLDAALGLQSGGAALTPSQRAQMQSGFGLAQSPLLKLIGPTRITFLGASITNGSSATNAGTTAYSPLVGNTGNHRRVLKETPYFGYPGQWAAYIATQLQTALASKPDVLILGPDFGTNGAASCVTAEGLTTNYITPLLEILDGCRVAGVRLVVCMTLPQGSEQADANTHIGIRLQNAWLAQSGRKLGFSVIDTYTTLIDHATGYLAAAYYNSADPVHPIDAGHTAIAAVINTWIAANIPEIPWPVGVGVIGLNANPLMKGAGTTPDNFAATVSPSTFAGVRTNVLENRADVNDLPAGRWYKVTADASASGHGALRTGTLAFSVTPGEQLMVYGYVKATGAATVQINTWNVSTTANHATLLTSPNDGVSRPFFSLVTVPAGCTSMRLIMTITTTTGQTGVGYLGAIDVLRIATVPA